MLRLSFYQSALIVLAFLLQAEVVFGQARYQISTTNLYCEVDILGPYVVLVPANGNSSSMTTATAVTAIKGKIASFTKPIKQTKAAIKSGKNVKKNKKKLSKLTADKSYWQKVIPEIVTCSLLPPLAIPTATPTATRPPTVASTPTATPTPSTPPGGGGVIPISNYYLLIGAEIYASDEQFLGVFSSNAYSSTSIANKYGSYGGDYGSTSIFNDYGSYGSDYSSKSPWNQYTSTPPIIYIGEDAVAYLTTNQFKTPRVDPYDILIWLGRTR